MTDPVIVSGLVELAKMGLSVYFQAARQANLSKEEARKLLESERMKFEKNTTDKLKDV